MSIPRGFAGGPYGRGPSRFTSYFKQVMTKLESAQLRAAERTAQWAEEEAKRIVPVRTGDLRDSIHSFVRRTSTSFAIIVMAGMRYALYVEFGTSNMSAQPYMQPVKDRLGVVYASFLKEEMR